MVHADHMPLPVNCQNAISGCLQGRPQARKDLLQSLLHLAGSARIHRLHQQESCAVVRQQGDRFAHLDQFIGGRTVQGVAPGNTAQSPTEHFLPIKDILEGGLDIKYAQRQQIRHCVTQQLRCRLIGTDNSAFSRIDQQYRHRACIQDFLLQRAHVDFPSCLFWASK